METNQRLNKKVTASGVIGTAIEWYDFYLYGTASALVFGKLFFPEFDPLAGTIAAFGTFAVGFLARPVGAAVFGHFGDRVGRKKMLVLTLLGMSLATVAVGLLPTYAAIGPAAPVLLVAFRLLQGFCVGGEWGGAMLMSVEHAPRNRKNLAGSLIQVGSPLGLVLATSVVAVFRLLPEESFLSWGWRVPFLLSAVLVVVGLFIRLSVSESPEFVRVRDEGKAAKLPLATVLRTAPLQVLLGVLLTCGPFGYFYFLTTFLLTFGRAELSFQPGFLLVAVAVAAAIEIVTLPLAGALADRVGGVRVFVVGALGLIVFAFPMVGLMRSADGSQTVLLLTMIAAMALIHPLTYALLSTMFASLFRAEVRYTGVSLAFQLGGVVGGFSPLILTSLLTSGSWEVLVPGYLVLLSVLTLLAALAVTVLARRRQVELVDDPAQAPSLA